MNERSGSALLTFKRDQSDVSFRKIGDWASLIQVASTTPVAWYLLRVALSSNSGLIVKQHGQMSWTKSCQFGEKVICFCNHEKSFHSSGSRGRTERA
jgi:hypothetical protein